MSIKCLMNGLEVNYPCSPACALFGDCVTAFEQQKKASVRTNADRIRAMTDEELAVALANSVIYVLLMAHDMSDEQEKVPKYLRDSLTQNYLKWLREPAEGE